MSESGVPLGERARALLDFERGWVLQKGRKETAIRELFDMSAARYYQLLAKIVELPEAEAYDPLTVRRLRRRRQERVRQRTARLLEDRPR